MSSSQRRSPIECRKPLAKCIAALFVLAAPEAFAATTWTVTTCADHGAGSLRDIVAAGTTLSGDTVDVSACSVSGISLTTGAIHVAQDSLFLHGPSGGFATISGYYNGSIEADRIVNHTGTGNLGLEYLRISYGSVSSSSNVTGGCVSSLGTVILNHTQILDCTAHGLPGGTAFGGGIYTKGNLISKYSQIVGNAAVGHGFSGGAHVRGVFTASSSTINGNHADGDFGGVYANSAHITSSTLSGNSAGAEDGGLYVFGNMDNSYAQITNSTISGNSAGLATGGMTSAAMTLTVRNSTIAFNTATIGKFDANSYVAPGLTVRGNGSGVPITVDLESSILSNNTYGTATEDDFSVVSDSGSTVTVAGSNNNIIRASLGPVHPSTIATACPLLGPLRDNGGPTLTHALLSHSPAIDAGNNNGNLADDQRSAGFARVSGAEPDIGAYEVQQADIIFNSSFEGCPTLF